MKPYNSSMQYLMDKLLTPLIILILDIIFILEFLHLLPNIFRIVKFHVIMDILLNQVYVLNAQRIAILAFQPNSN